MDPAVTAGRPKDQIDGGTTDANAQLRFVIDQLHQLEPRPALVIVSVDLADEGRADECVEVAWELS